jgi:hypothetical protein
MLKLRISLAISFKPAKTMLRSVADALALGETGLAGGARH